MNSVPLRHLLRVRAEVDRADLQVLSVYREYGVVPKSSRSDNFNKTPLDLARYQRVAVGDLVVNKMKAWSGSVAVSDHEGIVSPDYLVCEPLPAVAPRYLHYLLRSAHLIGEMRARSRGIRPSQERLYWEDLADIRVEVHHLDHQARIAALLDAESARIDRLIEVRRTQVDLAEERILALIGEVLSEVGTATPLKYLARILDTEHKTAPCVPGGGYWVARTTAIRSGGVVHADLYETDERVYREWTARGVPRPGDVLLTREAPVGESALLGPEDPPLCIGQRVVLIRSGEKLLPGFLDFVLRSPTTRRFYDEVTQGSLHPHLNMSDIGRLPVPLCDLDKQRRLVKHLVAATEHHSRLCLAQRGSVALLQERRTGLITAAVMGQLDVTTAQGAA